MRNNNSYERNTNSFVYELLFPSNEILFRSYEIIIRTDKLVFRSYELSFRTNEIIIFLSMSLMGHRTMPLPQTKFRQNRLTLKGRSAGQRHTDTQTDTDRQTRLKIRALQVLQSGQ